MIKPEVPVATIIDIAETNNHVEGQVINQQILHWRRSEHSREICVGTSLGTIVFIFWMLYLFGTPKS